MEHARPPPELSTDGSPVSRADAWQCWKTQFNLFLKASEVVKEDAATQASLLINLIGPEGFNAYQTFDFEKEGDRDSIKILQEKFDAYFGLKPNITLARYKFFTRNQEDGETISQYVTALRLLTKTCAFSSLEQDLIRDRIVCGIKSTIVRDRLLRTDDLTLDKAIKICQADEVSSDGSRRLEALKISAGPSQVDVVQFRSGRAGRGGRGGGGGRWRPSRGAGAGGAPGPARQRAPCPGCGQACDPGKCPANGVQCFKNGSLRICLDPRPLNCAVQRAHFQLPTINEIAAKLHGARLLKKESVWCWDSVHDAAFVKLKELVCNAPVLTLFDASQPVVVSVDASAVALGATLLQAGRPVEYASRTLTDTQTRALTAARAARRAREVLFWPGITRDIESYVRRCEACQECQNAPAREPMLPIPIPELPWCKVGMDIFEYRKQYFLIMVDYFSGFIEAFNKVRAGRVPATVHAVASTGFKSARCKGCAHCRASSEPGTERWRYCPDYRVK
ncbi:uncharacterized protein LOC125235799 [Leguminivora glycinivorella]|uniref:uncharacterized protein LOC125235799 n=1 Tax=Leguminivora glycinivorella TaxID=1035111 RepID=UPI0020104729|nr:uncharacterized protein LOC125235799 [Leguminivora glycinivorella]